MPSRLIDYDALWTSDRLALCKESIRPEYTWLYGLADANGCFEMNLNAIKSRVSAIRPKLSSARLQKIFDEFEAHGLLFTWISNGKRYGFWTNSDRPGRLPPAKERHRYKKFAPDVPKEGLTEYESRFNHDGLVSTSPPGVGFGLGLDRKGDGGGIGEEAPEALGVGAPAASLKSSASKPESASENPLAKTASAPSPLPFRKNEPTTKPERKTGRYVCEYCEKDFIDAREFVRHMHGKDARGVGMHHV